MTTLTVISVAPPPPPSLVSHKPLLLLSHKLTLTPHHPLHHRVHSPLRCSVAVRSDTEADSELDDEVKSKLDKVGSRVRVKSPMVVYHVPRLPEVELTLEMEGVVKQYVGFWKGKRITANYPFKVEFSIEVDGRGKVKFVTHLREDEIDFVE